MELKRQPSCDPTLCKLKSPAPGMRLITFIATFLCSLTPSLAQDDIGMLRQRLKNAKTDSASVDVYNELILHYQYANSDSAIWFANQGMALFTSNHYQLGIAKITSLLAGVNEIQGHTALAERMYQQAIELFTQLHYAPGIASSTNGLGVIASKKGNFDASAAYFMQALKIYDSLGDKKGLRDCYLKMGVVNEHFDNLDRALDYYNKSLALSEPKAFAGIAGLHNNIGVVFGKKGDMKGAMAHFEIALKNSDMPELAGVHILSLMNIGIVYDRMDSDELALRYYREALTLAKEKKLPNEIAHVNVNIASVISKTNPAKAIEYLKETLETAKLLGQKNLQAEILSDMTEIYKQLGNYKEALTSLQEQKMLQDSIFSMEKAKELANLQSVYELEQSNAKVKELETADKKSTRQRNIIIFVAADLAISLILLSFFYTKSTRLNKQLKKHEQELEQSNNIKDKLFSIIGHDLRGPMANIPVMMELLAHTTGSEEERKYLQNTLLEHSKASLETLDKLLYWGQSQIKGAGIKQEDFGVQPYLDTNMKLIKTRAEQKHITITNSIPNDIRLHADPTHFDFIIRNLLSNAVKFTYENGAIELSASTGKIPDMIVFAVQDNGTGISKEQQQRIFDALGSSKRGTADEQGNSIGLMLCKDFVVQNGGDIWVESEEGKGSVFYFSLKSA